MNHQVKSMREEVIALHEPAFYVGEFIKFIGKDKALVKMSHEGKYIVTINKNIDQTKLKTNVRIALKKETYEITKLLPTTSDPIVSLMKVEKVPDSTYDMIGGLKK